LVYFFGLPTDILITSHCFPFCNSFLHTVTIAGFLPTFTTAHIALSSSCTDNFYCVYILTATLTSFQLAFFFALFCHILTTLQIKKHLTEVKCLYIKLY